MHHLLKALVLCSSLLALCTAVIYRKNFLVEQDGSRVLVLVDDGRKVLIHMARFEGHDMSLDTTPRYLEVQLTGPNEMTKTIRIDDFRDIDGDLQSTILIKIFSTFQGRLDSTTFHKLIDIMEEKVLENKIHRDVLDALKALDMEKYDMTDNTFFKLMMKEDILRNKMMRFGMDTTKDMDMDTLLMEHNMKPFMYRQDVPMYNYKNMMMTHRYPYRMRMEFPYMMKDMTMQDPMMMRMMNKERQMDDMKMYDLMDKKYMPFMLRDTHYQRMFDKDMPEKYMMLKGDDMYRTNQRSMLGKILFGMPERDQTEFYTRRFDDNMMMNRMDQDFRMNILDRDTMYQNRMDDTMTMQRPLKLWNLRRGVTKQGLHDDFLNRGMNEYTKDRMMDNSYLTTRRMMREMPMEQLYL